MIQELDSIGSKALKEVGEASSLEALEQIRVDILGKKGSLSLLLRGMGRMDPTERPKVGAKANEWKQKIEGALTERKDALQGQALQARVEAEKIDTTLPGRFTHQGAGSLHVITQTTQRIIEVFQRIGFDVTTGPEVETEFFCFDAVNTPQDHPARDMQDTFFLAPGVVLRTQTSAIQMRAMYQNDPPIRVLSPGAVYRCDNDATHSPMFHQIEGLWVDRGVTLADLKGTLTFFAREVFGPESRIRLRPSFFPFVEPGAEVDVSCVFCSRGHKEPSPDCRICKGTGWLEILGAGMVHKNLYEFTGNKAYLEEGISGFAFGIGVERIAMLIHRIPEIRLLYQNDIRFLKQF